jgi:hypothetical protein
MRWEDVGCGSDISVSRLYPIRFLVLVMREVKVVPQSEATNEGGSFWSA